eukprot:54166-Rhodomonas_salina.1
MSGTALAYRGTEGAGTSRGKCGLGTRGCAITLRACYAVCGTELAYAAMRCPVLSWRTLLCGVRRMSRMLDAPPSFSPSPSSPFSPSPEYAAAAAAGGGGGGERGRAGGGIACYAVSGTELAYPATRCAVLTDRRLRMSYALRGTELGYAAT